MNDRTGLPAEAVAIAKVDMGKQDKSHNLKWVVKIGGASKTTYPFIQRDKTLKSARYLDRDWYLPLVRRGKRIYNIAQLEPIKYRFRHHIT